LSYRWPYDDFGRRYRVLYPEGKAMWRDETRKFAEKACTKCIKVIFDLFKKIDYFRIQLNLHSAKQKSFFKRVKLHYWNDCALKLLVIRQLSFRKYGADM
jgi:myosin heavy subunit